MPVVTLVPMTAQDLEAFIDAEVADHARERGARMVQLTSDARRADAHRFYERLGFEPSHVGFKLLL